MCLISYGCAFKSVRRSKGIVYIEADRKADLPEKKLNVFAPRNAENLPVLIFFHGGSWKSGKKELYSFLGNRLARRGVVTVIVDYPLSAEYQVPTMEKAAAIAVVWAAGHIDSYGGDPDRMLVSGHSAGGHLAALVSIKDELFEDMEEDNPLRGAFLLDPAGLDMYSYLMETSAGAGKKYLGAFTEDPVVWKQSSPIYFLKAGQIPWLILEGERTYPSIRQSRERFMRAVNEKGLDVKLKIYPRKKHIPMITQFLWTGSRAYKDLAGFIDYTVGSQ